MSYILICCLGNGLYCLLSAAFDVGMELSLSCSAFFQLLLTALEITHAPQIFGPNLKN